MRPLSLIFVMLFGILFARDYTYFRRMKKWDVFKAMEKNPPFVSNTGTLEEMGKEEAENFIPKYDYNRMMFRIAKRGYETTLVALLISVVLAFVDFLT
jgi:hypothetical protein